MFITDRSTELRTRNLHARQFVGYTYSPGGLKADSQVRFLNLFLLGWAYKRTEDANGPWTSQGGCFTSKVALGSEGGTIDLKVPQSL